MLSTECHPGECTIFHNKYSFSSESIIISISIIHQPNPLFALLCGQNHVSLWCDLSNAYYNYKWSFFLT